MRRSARLVCLGISALAFANAAPVFAQSSFTSLDRPPGMDWVYLTGMSADGSTFVGYRQTATSGFSWTRAGGYVDVPSLLFNGSNQPMAVNADGTVIVGIGDEQLPSGAVVHRVAYRWTANGGVQSLRRPADTVRSSSPTSVSADGSVVVGFTSGGSRLFEAFRWTAGTGMVDLGTLEGALGWSQALGVSSDGKVVVGFGTGGGAFRWTQQTGMTALHPDPASRAHAANVDGSVIVGDGGNANEGFRWTASTGAVGLGIRQGYFRSPAYGVSADGNTIVGSLHIGGSPGPGSTAFRWSPQFGMETLAEWMKRNGVEVAAGLTTQGLGVSADGTVMFGALGDSDSFIATGAGFLSMESFERSMQAIRPSPGQRFTNPRVTLHGAHGHPMARLLPRGRSALYASGDIGKGADPGADARFGVGEIGLGHAFRDDFQATVSIGWTKSTVDRGADGRTIARGYYAIGDVSMKPLDAHPLWLTATLLYEEGDAEITRPYVNAGLPDSSRGLPNTLTYGAALRADLLEVVSAGAFAVTPYAKLTWLESAQDAYTEGGGGFPARFARQRSRSQEIRAGFDATYKVTPGARALLGLAAVKSRDRELSPFQGTVIGLFDFSFPAQSTRRSWEQLTLGLETRLKDGAAAIYLNTTSEGAMPRRWIAANYRYEF